MVNQYPDHQEDNQACPCEICRFERFIFILDRLEAEQADKDAEQRANDEMLPDF